MNIFDELAWRGLVHQTSDAEGLRKHLDTSGRSLYCGFDPTAKSLHIGNMVPLLCLVRFAKAGHRPLALIGGGTGLIGDPSGKDKERALQEMEQVDARVECIGKQIQAIFERFGLLEKMAVVNNRDWLTRLSALDLLREVGKHFTVNYMLAKDAVKGRIGREDTGISYTEFSYMILQSYDYYCLLENQDCTLQIGGGDQYGNITAGLEFIRRKNGKEVFGLTFPLLTTASGAKFGKSEKGAIYMDPEMTSPYAFYQYWVNADDRDVVNLLKYFTFLNQEEIEGLGAEVEKAPHLRAAQKRLAQEMTAMVHGEDTVKEIIKVSEALFGQEDLTKVNPDLLRAALEAAPSVKFKALPEIPDLPQVLVELELCSSKSQARKDIKAGGIYLNNRRVEDENLTVNTEDLIGNKYFVLRKGKKNFGLVGLE